MKDRRNRTLVHRFQYKLLGRLLVYGVIYQASLWNFLFFWRLIQEGKGNLAEQYSRFFHDYYPMVFCFLLLVPLFVWDVIRFTHRVVGPIVRFRKLMRDITNGQPVRLVQLRAGDQLMEMQDDFNAMLLVLNEQGAVALIDPAGSDEGRRTPRSQLEAREQADSQVRPFPLQSA